MYKITLWDQNLDSCISGVATFFVEDLEAFENDRISQVGDTLPDEYYRSKNGECVTDYYSDNPELNVVQFDENCEILATKTFECIDKHIVLFNFYRYETELFASNVLVTLAHIKHNEKYFLIGKYKLLGVCKEKFFEEGCYERCTVYGNPVCIETLSEKALHFEEEVEKMRMEIFECKIKKEREKIRSKYIQFKKRNDPKDFEGCDLETYCYVTLEKYEQFEEFNLEEINEMTPELFIKLMRDIPGSCG